MFFETQRRCEGGLKHTVKGYGLCYWQLRFTWHRMVNNNSIHFTTGYMMLNDIVLYAYVNITVSLSLLTL